MKILFLTLLDINNINERNLYTDLMRTFMNKGHDVTILSPVERRNWGDEYKELESNVNILKAKIGNITKTNIIEKGISTISIDKIYLKKIKGLKEIDFDLVIYSTPPITFSKTINFIKQNTDAVTYLLLKDIFPQNAVDLHMMKKKGFLYKYFRKKEKFLYKNSDLIGCMSQRNIDFILENNKGLNLAKKTHLSPNSIEVNPIKIKKSISEIRKQYGIPKNNKVFIYGGNIGKPQGIDFLLNSLKRLENENKNAFFIIVGSGTEFAKVKEFESNNSLKNLLVLSSLPVEKFDELLFACDVGLILLDYRFTIPNFPSRLLSYMQTSLPILAATDISTDIGEVIKKNEFGFWSPSNDQDKFIKKVNAFTEMSQEEIGKMKDNAYKFLQNNYTSENSYKIIIEEVVNQRGR